MPPRLIPQYTLRRLLAITVGCAVAFSFVALGLRGYGWAAGVAIALLALVVLAAVFAGMFALVWAVAGAMSLGSAGRPGGSPFGPPAATAGPPATEAPAAPILLE